MFKEINMFFEDMRTHERSEGTIIDYTCSLKLFCDYFKITNIDELKELELYDFTNYMGYLKDVKNMSPATIHKRICAIKSFYIFLEKHKFISENVAKNVEKPKFEKTPFVLLEKDEIQNLLEETKNNNPKYNILIRLLATTGIRIDECLNLKISDIKDGYINVIGKGRKPRQVPLPKSTQNFLLEYIEYPRTEIILSFEEFSNNKYSQRFVGETILEKYKNYLAKRELSKGCIFLSSLGLKLDNAAFHRNIKKIAEKVGIDIGETKISAHKFRHYYTTSAIDNGIQLSVVSENLGHTNIQTTTSNYNHNKLSKRIESIELMDEFN